MTQGDERGYGGNEPGGRSDDAYSTLGGTRQTRTRLPGGGDDGDGYGRRPARNSRSLIMVVGVVVLLIAAIAFANQSGGGTSDGGKEKDSAAAGSGPTAATGTKPVTGKNGTIASGFAHDEQGAQSAAANYAVALGSAEMFDKDRRHNIVNSIYTSTAASELKGPQDSAYSTDFLSKLGLDADGKAPQGSIFISRTIPVGTKVASYSPATATVDVWYTGLIGMSGPESTDPVSTSWKTWTAELVWFDGDWKISSDKQKDGPAPVPGDVAASTSDEISKAVEEYGGFTYAR
ncbi:hypothetical protein [Streptomyces sp. NPDC005752]|uniref:hypothetical protein n=1 Tax=Streptomyces sp. NPDC005752 TaxID=3157065 RepID=UPI0033CA6F90